jgi:hypothetical protein
VAYFAFGTLWQSLQTDSFNDAQLQTLSQQWQTNHFLDVMVRSFEIERDMTIDQAEPKIMLRDLRCQSAENNVAAQKPIKWKANGLRHSYASYRFAQTADAGRVAGELGNSAAVGTSTTANL